MRAQEGLKRQPTIYIQTVDLKGRTLPSCRQPAPLIQILEGVRDSLSVGMNSLGREPPFAYPGGRIFRVRV